MTGVQDRLAAALAARYTLERELGRGGMATVWLAEDARHHRRVAIKVLHPELSAVLGSERFLKEIELTAGLQHPHILPLFDSGEADGLLYYVMPHVEGESLRSRLRRERQLPVADAVRLAREVADALAYAHRHGVVHRDIKPENILLHDGRALVADFGIALAVEQAGGERMTQTGLSLGTPQYMAPEQAAGERGVDHRADIYALGAVTYEMLAGEPPFTGPTAQAIVAKVMTEDPKPLGLIRRSVPPAVESAVLTALEKLPADRFSSVSEFAETLAGRPAEAERRPARRISRGGGWGWWIGAALAALLVAAGAYRLGEWRAEQALRPPLAFGRATAVTAESGLEVQPALSPDGRFVAYAAGTSSSLHILVRPVAGGRAIRLSEDNTEVQTGPRWNPDGSRVLYLARRGVFSAPATGGPARQELPAGRGGPVTWAAWSPDGQSLAYTVSDSLFLRNGSGATRRIATMLEPSMCAWSPGGTTIACASGNARFFASGEGFGNLSPSWIVLCRVSNGTLTTITDRGSLNHSPIWSPDGRWLYYVSDRLGSRDVYALRISAGNGAEGDPRRLTTGLGVQSISLSADGSRLAYSVLTATANIWSLPIPTRGPVSVATAMPVTTGSQVIETVSLPSDGQWLLFDSNLGGNSDVYRMRWPKGEPERLTTDPADEFGPELSPDGREVAFHSWRGGNRDIYVLPLDGGPVQQVTSSPRQEWMPTWSPDGRSLTFAEATPQGALWIVRREPNGAWGTPRQRIPPGAAWPTFSPDGRRLVYSTDPLLAGGSLLVVPVDSGPPVMLVDASQPGVPRAQKAEWSPDGRTIYFKSHDERDNAAIWSVPATGGRLTLLVRFDDPERPSYRGVMSVGNGRFYFPVENRQSDVWVVETGVR